MESYSKLISELLALSQVRHFPANQALNLASSANSQNMKKLKQHDSDILFNGKPPVKKKTF